MPKLRTLLLLYKRHWRVQPVTELLAVIGVAAGVALLFAVQVTNRSVTGSFEELSEGIAGRATIEAAARGPGGFDQDLLLELTGAPGVQAAAPVVEHAIRVGGPRGTRAVRLFGADQRVLPAQSGLLDEFIRSRASVADQGLLLPNGVAQAIGVRTGDNLTVDLGADRVRVPVADVATEDNIGSLVDSPLAAASLAYVQQLVELPGRLTRILIVPRPGHEAQAMASVERRLGDRLNVRSTDAEGALLRDAAKPERQLTTIFAAISLVVGTLLAYSAMLLALAERRGFVAYLRQLGASDRMIAATLLFDALALGLVGSLLGLVGGELLSRHVFHDVPGYLAASFPIGTQRVVGAGTVALAVGGGLLAALGAASGLVLSSWRAGATVSRSELAGSRLDRRAPGAAFGFGCLLVAAATTLALLVPSAAPVAVGAIAAGLVIALPPVVFVLVDGAHRASRRFGVPALRVALGELRSDRTRAVAVGVVGTIALFVIVTIGGSVRDVRRSVSHGAQDVAANADLWLLGAGEENIYATRPLRLEHTADQLRSEPWVENVVAYRGSFLDLTDRRIWAIGVDPSGEQMIAPSQFEHGDPALAEQRLRRGHGWAALTTSLAEDRDLALGDRFTLPTPSGYRRFRLAATVSNYGWIPGTVVLNGEDYSRAWQMSAPTALGVNLAPGTALAEGRARVAETLGPSSPVTVQTADERRRAITRTLGDTLVRLMRLSHLVLLAAILAVLAVTLGAIWARTDRLATLTSLGMSGGQLTRVALVEASGVLAAGCVLGLAFGLLGQAILIEWTHATLEAPATFSPAWQLGLSTSGIAVALTTVGIAMSFALRLRAENVPRVSPE